MRILLVDSDPHETRLLTEELESAGHAVFAVTDGKHALAHLLDTPSPLLVVGPAGARMSGLQLCRALRRLPSGRSAYVLLLLDDEARMIDAFDAGVDDVVLCPLEPGDVAMGVRRAARIVELQQQVEHDEAFQRTQLARIAELNRKLRAAALLDEPTRLPNRRYAESRLESAWTTAEAEGTTLSVLMVQIDFAPARELPRDELVRALAEEIYPLLNNKDTLARFRGQTLLVLRPGADEAAAAALAERLRAKAHGLLARSGLTEDVAIAVGRAVKGPRTVSAAELCAAASKAA